MGKVFVVNQSISSIGYVARTITFGEEYDMVNRFVSHVVRHYDGLRKKNAVIFLEPQVETGYPDIVIAEFYSFPSDKYSIRGKLNICDLKILFHIQQNKRLSVAQLTNDLGFSTKETMKSISKLSDGGLVHLSKKKTYVRSAALHNYYTIKKLISIEAKLDKWSEAIRQAEYNTWFASESYILLNKEKCNESIRAKCHDKGIGIILVNGRIRKILRSGSQRYPSSYASLQFNEWVYKYLNLYSEDEL